MSRWPEMALSEVLTQQRREEAVLPERDYRLLGAHWYAKGLYVKDEKSGTEIRGSKLYRVEAGDFVYNRLFAWKGSFAVASKDVDGCYVSNEFPCFTVDAERLASRYLWLYFSREAAWNEALGLSFGATPTSRNRLKEANLLAMRMPLPSVGEQRRVVQKLDRLLQWTTHARRDAHLVDKQVGVLVTAEVGRMIESVAGIHEPLGDLLAEPSRNGLSTRPSDTPPGLPILRISAATSRADAVVDEADVKYLPLSRSDADAYWLQPGDLLACRFNGNLGYVGRFSRYLGLSRESQVYPDKLIRFRVDAARVRPEFVCLAMNSRYGREQIERFCQTTAGNIGISAGNLKTVGVPTPSLDVQSAILRRASFLQERVTVARRRRAQVATTLDAVMPAVMSEFWG